jgi:hypothetical protein
VAAAEDRVEGAWATTLARMRLPFVHDGWPGQVDVEIRAVDDPSGVGKPRGTEGFPACTASVDYPFRGYGSLFGWVQLVQSDDNSSGGSEFDMGPFVLFADAPSPYCFFGVLPTLFDAPSRDDRAPLAWLVHSFLARTPRREVPRRVRPLAGFSWGFRIDQAGSVVIEGARELPDDAWRSHLPQLRACYPGWQLDHWTGPTAEM